MHKHLMACLLVGATLGGCSSLPKIATPDGHDRRPANTQIAIDQYTASLTPTPTSPALVLTPPDLTAMRDDVAVLKEQVAALMAERDLVARPVKSKPARKRPQPKRAPAKALEKASAAAIAGKPSAESTGSNHKENAR